MQDVQTTLPINSVIRERYVVEALLGQGGFGAVYRVRDLRVKGNLFALKEVIEPQRKDRTKKDRSRFTFEGEVLKRLDHSALPRVYRVFSNDANDRSYTLMDYIDGPNLEQLRQQQPDKRFALADVLRIMFPITDAIHYLHSQNPPIIHRDIKPANIIVPTPHEAVLVDFDIAKEYEPDSTTTAVRRCSPGYGAPEQYGQGTTTRTDIYGLGATIYTLLTGTVPPDALYRMTILGARGHDPLIPINQLVPDISTQVAATIQRAMALHSHDRYATIEEFWQEFDIHATIKEAAIIPAALASSAPLSHQAPQPPVPAKSTSGNTTTVPTQRLAPTTPAPTQPRKRAALFLALLLLTLFVVGASAASLWSFFGHRQDALSDTPEPRPQATAAFSPVADSTATSMPTSTPFALKKGPTAALTPSPTSIAAVPSVYPTTGSTPQPTLPVPTSQPTPHPQPTPTPIANPYPNLSSAYSGTVDDTTPTPHITTNMYLTSIRQNKGNITGSFSVSAPLQGNGPFTGTIDTNSYIQFVVKGYNGNAPLYFWGFVQSNKSIKGQYCSLDTNGQCSASAGASGYWYVAPGLSGSS